MILNNIANSVDTTELFKNPHWSNYYGKQAIESKINRDKANAVMLFGQTYFKTFFPTLHPELHIDVLSLFSSNTPLKACAVPRGHSKSTLISFLLVMYRIVFQERSFIVIVSESEDKAKDFVVRIRDELEFNHQLIRDFSPKDKFKTTDWAKTDFTTSTGIRVVAKGAGQSLRGLIHRDTRPDMVVLDDIETNETAGTDTIERYLLTDVLPSTNRRGVYDICYVGTIIKDMSTLHKVILNPEWACAKWECMDSKGEMLAPMLLPKDEYERQKRMYQHAGKMGIFYAENHNNPMVADDDATFKQEYFQYYNELPYNVRYFIFYDIAMPPSGRTKVKRVDYSVLLVLATDEKKNWYIVRCIANRETPSKNRQKLFQLVKKYTIGNSPPLVQIETISAQRGIYLEIKDEMKRKEYRFPIREIPSHSGSKEARIEQLQPLYEAGLIYHNKNDCYDLEQELLMFGRTPHDDRSDTLSFALNRVTYPKPVPTVQRSVKDFYDKFLAGSSSESWKVT